MLARPTVHGILQTLQANGFVEQDPGSGKYQLGAGLLRLGYSYLDLNELRARSLAYADGLAVRADSAVRVGVMHGDSVMIVHHVFRPDASLQVLEVGSQLPLHASALGKAILAYLPAAVVADLTLEPLPRLTNGPSLRGSSNSSSQIRRHRVASERDEAVLGESSLAAPISDHSAKPIGAIGVVGETEHIFGQGGRARYPRRLCRRPGQCRGSWGRRGGPRSDVAPGRQPSGGIR